MSGSSHEFEVTICDIKISVSDLFSRSMKLNGSRARDYSLAFFSFAQFHMMARDALAHECHVVRDACIDLHAPKPRRHHARLDSSVHRVGYVQCCPHGAYDIKNPRPIRGRVAIWIYGSSTAW